VHGRSNVDRFNRSDVQPHACGDASRHRYLEVTGVIMAADAIRAMKARAA